jgi:hypothetical protein
MFAGGGRRSGTPQRHFSVANDPAYSILGHRKDAEIIVYANVISMIRVVINNLA